MAPRGLPDAVWLDEIRRLEGMLDRQQKEIGRLLVEIERKDRHLERQSRALDEGWKAIGRLPIKIDNTLTFAAACEEIGKVWTKLTEDCERLRQHATIAQGQRREALRELERVRKLDEDVPAPRRPRGVPS